MKSQSEKAAGWKVQEMESGIYHVFPVDEEDSHVLFGTACPCGTQARSEGAVIVHAAFDGREWAERAAEIFDHPERFLNGARGATRPT
jgi:hypothetical protein